MFSYVSIETGKVIRHANAENQAKSAFYMYYGLSTFARVLSRLILNCPKPVLVLDFLPILMGLELFNNYSSVWRAGAILLLKEWDGLTSFWRYF